MRAELATTLKRRTTELLEEVETSKEPILITKHGLPSAYLVDAQTYEFEQQRFRVLEAIALGERDIAEGRVVSEAEADRRLSKWLD